MSHHHARRGSLSGVLLFFVAAMASTACQANTLSFQSTPGDWVGAGQSLTFTTGVTATASTSQNMVMVSVNTPTHWYNLDMMAPSGQTLAPGVYSGAVRYPFQSALQPGLNFSGDGRGCNTLSGTFTINAIKVAAHGYVESLDATWVQYCEGTMPPLYGQVTIANPPPPPDLELTLVASPEASISGKRVTVGGTITCSVETTVQMHLGLAQRTGRRSMASGGNNVTVSCGPTPTRWTSSVMSEYRSGFTPGHAQLDVIAYAYDPNYGGSLSKLASAVVVIKPRHQTVVTAQGLVLPP